MAEIEKYTLQINSDLSEFHKTLLAASKTLNELNKSLQQLSININKNMEEQAKSIKRVNTNLKEVQKSSHGFFNWLLHSIKSTSTALIAGGGLVYGIRAMTVGFTQSTREAKELLKVVTAITGAGGMAAWMGGDVRRARELWAGSRLSRLVGSALAPISGARAGFLGTSIEELYKQDPGLVKGRKLTSSELMAALEKRGYSEARVATLLQSTTKIGKEAEEGIVLSKLISELKGTRIPTGEAPAGYEFGKKIREKIGGITGFVRGRVEKGREAAAGIGAAASPETWYGKLVHNLTGTEHAALGASKAVSSLGKQVTVAAVGFGALNKITGSYGLTVGLLVGGLSILIVIFQALIYAVGNFVQGVGLQLLEHGKQYAEVFSEAEGSLFRFKTSLQGLTKQMGSETVGTFEDWSEWIDKFSFSIKRSQPEIYESSGLMLEMASSLKFNKAEMQKLLQVSADYAAQNREDLLPTVQTLTNAIYGYSASARVFGINLLEAELQQSEFAKATGKTWEAMTLEERARVRLNVLFKQAQTIEGSSIQRVNTLKGATDAYNAALVNLYTTMGKGAETTITPYYKMLANLTNQLNAIPKPVLQAAGSIEAMAGSVLYVIGAFVKLSVTLLGITYLIKGLSQVNTLIVYLFKRWGINVLALVETFTGANLAGKGFFMMMISLGVGIMKTFLTTIGGVIQSLNVMTGAAITNSFVKLASIISGPVVAAFKSLNATLGITAGLMGGVFGYVAVGKPTAATFATGSGVSLTAFDIARRYRGYAKSQTKAGLEAMSEEAFTKKMVDRAVTPLGKPIPMLNRFGLVILSIVGSLGKLVFWLGKLTVVGLALGIVIGGFYKFTKALTGASSPMDIVTKSMKALGNMVLWLGEITSPVFGALTDVMGKTMLSLVFWGAKIVGIFKDTTSFQQKMSNAMEKSEPEFGSYTAMERGGWLGTFGIGTGARGFQAGVLDLKKEKEKSEAERGKEIEAQFGIQSDKDIINIVEKQKKALEEMGKLGHLYTQTSNAIKKQLAEAAVTRYITTDYTALQTVAQQIVSKDVRDKPISLQEVIKEMEGQYSHTYIKANALKEYQRRTEEQADRNQEMAKSQGLARAKEGAKEVEKIDTEQRKRKFEILYSTAKEHLALVSSLEINPLNKLWQDYYVAIEDLREKFTGREEAEVATFINQKYKEAMLATLSTLTGVSEQIAGIMDDTFGQITADFERTVLQIKELARQGLLVDFGVTEAELIGKALEKAIKQYREILRAAQKDIAQITGNIKAMIEMETKEKLERLKEAQEKGLISAQQYADAEKAINQKKLDDIYEAELDLRRKLSSAQYRYLTAIEEARSKASAEQIKEFEKRTGQKLPTSAYIAGEKRRLGGEMALQEVEASLFGLQKTKREEEAFNQPFDYGFAENAENSLKNSLNNVVLIIDNFVNNLNGAAGSLDSLIEAAHRAAQALNALSPQGAVPSISSAGIIRINEKDYSKQEPVSSAGIIRINEKDYSKQEPVGKDTSGQFKNVNALIDESGMLLKVRTQEDFEKNQRLLKDIRDAIKEGNRKSEDAFVPNRFFIPVG